MILWLPWPLKIWKKALTDTPIKRQVFLLRIFAWKLNLYGVFTFQAHLYQDGTTLLLSNEKCCGLNRISNTLSCCNGQGYNPATQVCADFGEFGSVCGTGVTCPIGKPYLSHVSPMSSYH